MYSGSPRSSLISGLRRSPLQPSSARKWQNSALPARAPSAMRRQSTLREGARELVGEIRDRLERDVPAARRYPDRLAQDLAPVGADVDVRRSLRRELASTAPIAISSCSACRAVGYTAASSSGRPRRRETPPTTLLINGTANHGLAPL